MLFDQRRTGQIVFIFTQRQFGFVLPFTLLGFTLIDTTDQLFLFCQRTGGGRTQFHQRVFHFLNHQTNQFLRIFCFIQQGVDVGVNDVSEARKNTHNRNSSLFLLVSGQMITG
ncbi:hypothetical protein SRABI106_04404 [Rahnella aquatilis]|nr:hypothetical protein SRABI106_04404 [Rahnella aquatilis]